MSSDPAFPTLYDPSLEHDACGVGLVCRLDAEPTHAIVRQGLRILENLDHRGACGCDADTGDGAGILLQLPDAFLRHAAGGEGIGLPEPGAYGVGMLFLPTDASEARYCKETIEAIVREEGQVVLGWREVPARLDLIGQTARLRAPAFWQLFVGRGGGLADAAAFERRLYVIRKRAANAIAAAPLSQHDRFYFASFSARTIVYKGMLTTSQLDAFYPDLSDERLSSALALVHSRFSTNTLPRWPLAQPFRYLCHNGEINTLRGNINWMRARESLFESPNFGADMSKLLPILTEGTSDSAMLDNAVELLVHSGRSLPHAMLMLVPEAWEGDRTMDEERRAFYEYHACLIEPWDGPAALPFSDGRYVGALLDRNGLRPSRYTVTSDGLVVLASETGVLDLDPATVVEKGRLQPGKMLLVDLEEHRLVHDDEIKDQLARRRPYRTWLDENLIRFETGRVTEKASPDASALRPRQRLFGYTMEDERTLLPPMTFGGKEALGSMGDDSPLAVLSDRPRLLFDYFRQLFAQVTNPPLDAIREELVTSLQTYMGAEGDLFEETPGHAHQIRLDQPILTAADLAELKSMAPSGFPHVTLPIVYDAARGGGGLETTLEALCEYAAQAVRDGNVILLLSDREVGPSRAPIPSLLALGAVHHHLIREKLRTQCALVVESGEPREVHHFCLLLGYGASAVHPYLALDTVRTLAAVEGGGLNGEEAVENYIHAVGKGVLKVMSKMGISTLRSYQAAQIFEALGVSASVVDRYFTRTPTRIGGVGLDEIAEETRRRHAEAYPEAEPAYRPALPSGGRYAWRRDGEHHLFNPLSIARLQRAARSKDAEAYEAYAAQVNDQSRRMATLRGLLDFAEPAEGVPLEEVEPWTEIVTRFKTGAMSYGSISEETHETLARAMNAIGGRSNTGEGGEAPERYGRDRPHRSRIKQVASGRFGVTIDYLASADEIQIKMAQGAKPGEGGQLPGEKVYPWIARTRHSTPYVGLISPPPHHDIYSIEDLAQLIHDLKNANPSARISVKLVSEVGVGTIAAGVAKGKADVILISGHDGGTGASPQTSIAHAGLPWELGLTETHQALVLNGLRSRVRLECDGQLKTGRDVAVAALLGADEFGFATAPLVALGCIMMRKCHLNTCPVGIATQDPRLRRLFAGEPEHVVNFLYFVAEELRGIMARLGFRTLGEMVGRVDRLRVREGIDHWKARTLDLRPLLAPVEVPEPLRAFQEFGQDHGLEGALDHRLVEAARPALESGRRVEILQHIRNTHRTLGTQLSHAVAVRYGPDGLPDDTIRLRLRGSAGQSLAAFGARGLTFDLIGDANDYLGKGLSGARIVVRPPEEAAFRPHENTVVGNVALYGATSGEVFIRGRAGERFAVRNSGASAVVEGVGDHGCEYMTGGRVVILGPTGRNFAAGMSGGIAYVLDGTWDFRHGRCNTDMVELLSLEETSDGEEVRALVEAHLRHTDSEVARWVLDHWQEALREFVRVMPTEYRLALQRLSLEASADVAVDEHRAA